jgi:hypothetical protein
MADGCNPQLEFKRNRLALAGFIPPTGPDRDLSSTQGVVSMSPNKLISQGLIAGAVMLATTLSAGARTPSAKMSFDGPWSVLIVTDYGSCDRAYRYGVQISNGRVFSQGSGADISGRVSPRGQVSVQVRQGDQQATGTGRLSEESGGGRWSGASPNQQCGGHWVAERRAF